MKFLKKSQVALEFLMTYGWAILVVLVAIGALAYFGVLSPDKFLPSKCTLPAGMACIDHKAVATGAEEGITIVVRNGMGFDATLVTVAISGCTVDATGTIPNGATAQFKPSGCGLTAGSKYKGDVNISYTNADTSLTHKVQGEILTKVE